MNTLGYKVRPSSSGGWTTYLDLGPDLAEDEFLSRMSAACGQPVEVCRIVGTELVRQLMEAAREGRACPNLFDLLRAEPTSGGAAEETDGFHAVEDIEFALSIGLLPKARKALRKDVHIERRGTQGTKTAEVTLVINLSTDRFNEYTPGTMILLRGRSLKFDPRDPEVGVFFQPADGGAEVRCQHYGPCTKGRAVALVPPGLTGPQQLIVRVRLENSLRTTYYSPYLQPA